MKIKTWNQLFYNIDLLSSLLLSAIVHQKYLSDWFGSLKLNLMSLGGLLSLHDCENEMTKNTDTAPGKWMRMA